jgi:enoyl-[acyl-carrier-protein] reductase (NADH)
MFFSKIKSKELEDDDINLIFNRDSLKSTIMTEKYAAGEKKCYEYFKKKTEKIVNTYDIKKKREIRKIFTKFYYFLKKIDFFEYSIDKSKEYFKERNYNFNLKDARINLLYTKTYTKQ